MKYQIDQSGKVEDTARNTVIAYSNEKQKVILITRKTKRRIQEVFRLCGAIRLFIYFTFAVGIFYLIEDVNKPSVIIIDLEYFGKDKIITQIINKLLVENNKPKHTIKFARIGNKPRVHYAAKNVFDGKKKANRVISFKELIKQIKKTDGRLRECFETLVGVQSRSIKQRITKNKLNVKSKKNSLEPAQAPIRSEIETKNNI